MPGAGDIIVRRSGRYHGLFAAMAPGRILDVPSGGGEQSRALIAMGYRVISVDLFPAAVQAGSLVRADANRTLPFRAGSFDYVLSREGIEHLEDQISFLRECRRVLKPGGTIVVTTPNIMHLSARLSLLLTNQRNMRRGLINEEQALRAQVGGHLYHGHVFLLDYFRLRYMMRVAGFDRLAVYSDRYSPTSIALAPLAPAVALSMRYAAWTAGRANRAKRRPVASAAVIREIIGHVMSPALLFGKRMIMTAVASERSF
jgi:SAM-dependent methyltransferase